MTIATATTLDADGIGRISDQLDEPDWLRDLRAAWWQRAETTPPPTGQEEEWRRTDLADLPRAGGLLVDQHWALHGQWLEPTKQPASSKTGLALRMPRGAKSSRRMKAAIPSRPPPTVSPTRRGLRARPKT